LIVLYQILLSHKKSHPIDVAVTFLGPHAVPKDYKGREDDFIDFQIEKVLPEVVNNNLAEFADIFVHG